MAHHRAQLEASSGSGIKRTASSKSLDSATPPGKKGVEVLDVEDSPCSEASEKKVQLTLTIMAGELGSSSRTVMSKTVSWASALAVLITQHEGFLNLTQLKQFIKLHDFVNDLFLVF